MWSVNVALTEEQIKFRDGKGYKVEDTFTNLEFVNAPLIFDESAKSSKIDQF